MDLCIARRMWTRSQRRPGHYTDKIDAVWFYLSRGGNSLCVTGDRGAGGAGEGGRTMRDLFDKFIEGSYSEQDKVKLFCSLIVIRR